MGLGEAPVRLCRWAPDDLELLRRMNTPEMWAHLGGPEDDGKVMARHYRYLDAVSGETRMFTIVFHEVKVGNIGYWIRQQGRKPVFETGWMVTPEAQGHGVASAAARLVLDILRHDVGSGSVHAYPSVDHPASNAVCRKAGFTLVGPTDVEFPAGQYMQVNDWVYPF